ncbi:hypothetical protein AAFF_G00220400 [Aldrovandia affinis]|uniref:Uncharacterized protein n=1 Tax=Aldrovandia affinis TaxID=143900 RepID=A0AAD7W5C7_9TELE|nr:hypothetical protein AAFF_G00220400 [Aldrovandia affinis]
MRAKAKVLYPRPLDPPISGGTCFRFPRFRAGGDRPPSNTASRRLPRDATTCTLVSQKSLCWPKNGRHPQEWCRGVTLSPACHWPVLLAGQVWRALGGRRVTFRLQEPEVGEVCLSM